ncbi:glutamyl-tRNA synthetase [Desulfovibrio sp. X2]|uniref:glutamate--tRNA ligase n=1 Tax=Desulfovibrio sp. X2 TaxID=941449 RepID=UPI000358A291|nr:glutamate--tRNA ligase [Desulfovibrio sp. X2]EPR44805.1 glutamyl-tRNA synthetase [Desulfovibrio sp. X2]
MSIVTRFAPSPTGYLHVGGARTAIFSWLLARHEGGRFLLRIEDTDRERSTPEATRAILDGMSWLGLEWDGEICYQSSREERHNAAVDRLLAEGKAYWCECTPDEVEAMRERARAEGRKPKYDGRCRERGLGPGPGRVVRLKAPLDGATSYEDMVKGYISIANEEMDDLILRRSDGSPTYNLAVVVDDAEMGVTHVLRGEDHVSNTPRQILIYKALGLPVPRFGHVPMILGPDKKKLSKRHGATSVFEYHHQGILPEAMVNYLARLGWSSGDQEIFSREELVKLFTVDNLGTSAAVFDMDKLLWLNAHYIKESSPERLADLLPPFYEAQGMAAPERDYLLKVVPHYQPRAKTLVEFVENSAFFFTPDEALAYDQAAAAKFLTPEAKEHVRAIRDILKDLPDFEEATVEAALAAYVESSGASFKVIAQPLRVAVTGSTRSPGLHQTLSALGRGRTLARIERALAL